jgi:hypothetical protein
MLHAATTAIERTNPWWRLIFSSLLKPYAAEVLNADF